VPKDHQIIFSIHGSLNVSFSIYGPQVYLTLTPRLLFMGPYKSSVYAMAINDVAELHRAEDG
jgi:hypothetical protein